MRQSSDPADDVIYTEMVSSNKTEALFLALTLLSLLLFLWRVNMDRLDVLAVVFLVFLVFSFSTH